MCDDHTMTDEPAESLPVTIFTKEYEDLRSCALGTLFEPEWLEQQLPIGIAEIRAKHPNFSEAQLQVAIFTAGVQKAIQWLDCGEMLIQQVLEKVSAISN